MFYGPLGPLISLITSEYIIYVKTELFKVDTQPSTSSQNMVNTEFAGSVTAGVHVFLLHTHIW